MAIITQDGLFRYTRMAFGPKTAPRHFQRTVKLIVEVKSDLTVVIYLDDIIIHGTEVEEVWRQTLVVLRRLTASGFMININVMFWFFVIVLSVIIEIF